MGFLSVTIDLDEVYCYLAIHGLDASAVGDAAHAVYEKALPRVAEFFEELDVSATLFVVGKDLEEPKRAEQIRTFAQRGHEVGNHTMTHAYDFSLKLSDTQSREIDDAHNAIAAAVGAPPVGFRAPGYNINTGIIELLKQKGYLYDSSVFPCPAYYAAKAGAIGLKSMQGMQSKSVIGDPRVLKAPVTPYRIGEDGIWCRDEEGLRELPITVVTRARVPFIGTAVAVMGTLPAKLLAKQAAKLSMVNFELHGMDFLDAEKDNLGFLKPHQTDLKVPLARRRKSLETAVKTLLDAGLEPVPLRDAANRLFL